MADQRQPPAHMIQGVPIGLHGGPVRENRLWAAPVKLLLVGISAIWLLACTAPVRIPAPQRIQVPSAVAAEDVEEIILAAVMQRPAMVAAPVVSINTASPAAQELLRGMQQRRVEQETWEIYHVEPGVVTAANHVSSHLLVVAIRHTPDEYWIEIVSAENLSFGNGRIHPNALRWRSTLESRIRSYFGLAAAYSASASGSTD